MARAPRVEGEGLGDADSGERQAPLPKVGMSDSEVLQAAAVQSAYVPDAIAVGQGDICTVIEFLKTANNYRRGDKAGFPDEMAQRFVAARVARLVERDVPRVHPKMLAAASGPGSERDQRRYADHSGGR